MTSHQVSFDTVPEEARSFHGQPAGLVTRTLANVVDLIVVAVLLAAVYLGVAGVLFLRRGPSFSFPIVSYPVAFAVGFVAWIVYMAVGWGTNGRSYGDQLLGLRVCTVDDGELRATRAVIRAVLCAIAPLLLVWVALSKQQRSVQDLLVGTHVVYDWGGSRRARPSSGDATGVGVDVAATVADEPDHGHAEPLPHVDGER
jgi:uncharacterized RDD family membrane protein YckC